MRKQTDTMFIFILVVILQQNNNFTTQDQYQATEWPKSITMGAFFLQITVQICFGVDKISIERARLYGKGEALRKGKVLRKSNAVSKG